jgi:beta-glucosidase
VDLFNIGNCEAEEVVQLYIRDLVGNVTRPVKELKGFQKLRLKPGENKTITFEINTDDLAFYDRQMQRITEPGKFHAWIGGDSDTGLQSEFEVLE